LTPSDRPSCLEFGHGSLDTDCRICNIWGYHNVHGPGIHDDVVLVLHGPGDDGAYEEACYS